MNNFKFFTGFVVVVAAIVGGFWLVDRLALRAPGLPIPPPISQIHAMSDLATLRVQIADSLTGENNNWELRWMLHGEAVLGVDLSQVTYTMIDARNRKVTVALPNPHVISSKVDHHRSVELTAKPKWHLPLPGLKSLRDEVWKHADEKVARIAHHDGYMEASRHQAERVLNKLFRDVDWTVSYEWKSNGSQQPDPAAQSEDSRMMKLAHSRN